MKKIALSLVLFVSAIVHAQPWSGIIDTKRAIDWSQAGATITNRTTVCTTESPGASSTQINNDISACPVGQVVFLSAGTYNLSSCLNLKSGVTLRGASNATKLVFSAGCAGIDGSKVYAIGANGSYNPAFGGAAPGPDGANPSLTIGWSGTNGASGTYTKGATVINLASAPTGPPALQVGDILDLVQNDDANSAVPKNGFFVSSCNSGCSGPLGGNVSKDGSGINAAAGTGMRQNVVVTAINGSSVTVTPPIMSDQWRTSQIPIAYWWGGAVHDAGVENMLIEINAVSMYTIVSFFQCHDCWETGVASHETAARNHVNMLLSTRVTLTNNYFQGSCVGGCSATATGYQVESYGSSSLLIQNNILDGGQAPLVMDVGTGGSVLAYNFTVNQTGTDSTDSIHSHEEEFIYNLLESNDANTYFADFFHGTQHFTTSFRNRFHSGGYPTIDVASYNRWHQAIGNVLGDASSLQYNCLENGFSQPNCDRFHDVIFRLGWPSQVGDPGQQLGINPDAEVATGFMRWGNYDTVTAAVRWCASSDPNFANPPCSSTSEIPTGDTWYPSANPSNHTLPASFYLSSKPSWWSSRPWPAIGPDVSGGNISGYAGHAYTIPSSDCYQSTGGVLANFNASTCYGSINAPSPPTNLVATPQ